MFIVPLRSDARIGQLTPERRKEVERLTDQMRQLHEVIVSVLSLADELKEGTIEKELAKSDVELGLALLLKDRSAR